MPARFRFYNEAILLFEEHLATTLAYIKEKYGREARPDTHIPFQHELGIATPLELPSLGSDACALEHEGLIRATIGPGEGVLKEHSMLDITLGLFKDGSPFVRDKDVAIYDASGEDPSDLMLRYELFLSHEMPPTMVHTNQAHGRPFNPENFQKMNKHLLTDDECQRLLDYLKTQLPNPSILERDEIDFIDEDY